jgi:hypothetical protein
VTDPPVSPTDSPVDTTPKALKPATFGRFDSAVRYVEGLIRTRAPRGRTGRPRAIKPGAWGLLAPGDTIGAGSGLSLGSGTVTLCTQDGGSLTDSGVSVTVYNSGPAISAAAYSYGDPGEVVRLAWTDGGWAVNCWGGTVAYGYG